MSVIDLIIRIKNGYLARRDSVETPYSNFRGSVLQKLKALGYVADYEVSGEKNKKHATITLKYDNGMPAFTDVKIFSTPGRRWYIKHEDVKSVLGGLGHAIISTSKGIKTDREARKELLGGELLFHIW
ncbi:30S ribosomal protein S8 [Candidatus Woesebacteria bacterium]|nr:30S ribosomal protein S8 [Candidatus Woesebacteria bacterium]